MAVIGYARVSTSEQNLDLQLTALRPPAQPGSPADNGVSGSTVERPQLSKATPA
jgi:DNA invertase Pin-like site-specific DNA recombinase